LSEAESSKLKPYKCWWCFRPATGEKRVTLPPKVEVVCEDCFERLLRLYRTVGIREDEPRPETSD
jgi:hypothetical protein